MIDLVGVVAEMSDDIDGVTAWCDAEYQENFGSYFHDARLLFDRMQSKEHPITDEELSWILINLPMQLFDVSEALNRMRLNMEVVKMRVKSVEHDIISKSQEKSATKKNAEAAVETAGGRLLISAYSSIISRVESEISFSRELIMGAKKIWDGRRKGEQANPVQQPNDLPEYSPSYIKGV